MALIKKDNQSLSLGGGRDGSASPTSEGVRGGSSLGEVREDSPKNFAFDKVNLMLLAVGMVVVILGFVLMSGGSSTESAYNPDIFSVRRVKVAPVVCFLGFISMIYAIVRKPRD